MWVGSCDTNTKIDAKRREPWLFGEPWTSIIRDAIRSRYAYLPFIYTVFHESSVTGMPIMRPLWVEFPDDAETYSMEDQFMLGNALLIKPVTKSQQTSVNVYLPGTQVCIDACSSACSYRCMCWMELILILWL
jgi:alpha 1,3-glucosidase